MRTRIVAGTYGGRFIESPSKKAARVMSERARGALFNSLGSLVGLRVLDAFAGSGALGIEALSRGASEVVFIERERTAQVAIAANIDTLGITDSTKLIRASVGSWHQTSEGALFDVILADPPYHDLQFSTIAKLFMHLKTGGTMVLSHAGREPVPLELGVVVVDNRSYGDASLALYRKE